MFAFPFALTYTFGRMAGNQRQGWTIFAAMAAVFIVGAVVAMHAEALGNPLYPVGRRPGARQHGGRRHPLRRDRSAASGRRSRRARAPARSTPGTTASSRSAGLVPLFNIELGEITPGGIGAGPVRDARDRRDPVRLHRRAHGRPDARVPRQEGRELRDEDGDDRRPRPRARASSASPRSRR